MGVTEEYLFSREVPPGTVNKTVCLRIKQYSLTKKNLNKDAGLSKKSVFAFLFTAYRRPMWRSGRNTRLLRKRSRVRFPHSTNICVHEHVCLYWVWVFLCIICMYVFTKKMDTSMY
jgi:hypothetical protein